jgi:hypothetical protein
MPKDTRKDVTNAEVPVSVTVHDAIGRGDTRSRRPTPEDKLSEENRIAVRTEPGAATAADGKYRKEFTAAGRADDWNDGQHEAMHAANAQQTKQAAMYAGLRPTGESVFEGARRLSDATRPCRLCGHPELVGPELLVYAVPVEAPQPSVEPADNLDL